MIEQVAHKGRPYGRQAEATQHKKVELRDAAEVTF